MHQPRERLWREDGSETRSGGGRRRARDRLEGRRAWAGAGNRWQIERFARRSGDGRSRAPMHGGRRRDLGRGQFGWNWGNGNRGETQDAVSGRRRGYRRQRGSTVRGRRVPVLQFRGTLGSSNCNRRNSDTRGKCDAPNLRYPTDIGVGRDARRQYNLVGTVDSALVGEGNKVLLL